MTTSFFQQKQLSVLLTREQIQARVDELGATITKEYGPKLGPDGELVVIGILKGSFVFLADLVRARDLPIVVDFIGLSSYGDASESSGVVQLTQDLSRPISGKHVLVVEDIIDTGLTLSWLVRNLSSRNPASVALCTLLRKPEAQRMAVEVSYVGFDIPNEFVVGYGLDYGERYRNLRCIGTLAPAVYTSDTRGEHRPSADR